MEWNVNGWFSDRNPYYQEFKVNVVQYLNIDIVVIPETHCMEHQIIKIDNYKIFQQNRPVVNANARKGSGGLAIAIKCSLLQNHSVESVLQSSTDGLLGLKLINNETQFKLGIVANYLSPDSYHYGQDSEGYFNNLTSIWQDLSDCDLCVGTGDLNARTKQLKDFIPELDGNLPERKNPDNVKNSHGGSFLTFLKDNRAIILNGRVTPQLNNFTFVSTRGSSVPDYMYCPINQLEFCTQMKTLLMSEIVNLTKFIPPQNLPDHSILIGTFRTSQFIPNSVSKEPQLPFPENIPVSKKQPKKNISKIGETFFMSKEIHEKVLETIKKLETSNRNQNEIDKLWGEIKQLFLSELSSLPNLPQSNNKKQTNHFKKCREFWNEDLAHCWQEFCRTEKEYLAFKVRLPSDRAIKQELLYHYKTSQKTFDSKFRFYKRKHKKHESIQLEQDSLKNPRNMWEKLKKLGDPPSSKAVLEIIRQDESISTDLQEILMRWQNDISKLFSGLREEPEFVFDDIFYEEILNKKKEFENICPEDVLQDSKYDSAELNSEILYNEVSKCIDSSKLHKAYLDIPNEALKNTNAKLLLYKFFKICFESGLNPADWDNNDIKPIPKKDKDQRDPLQNRCITIMCCVAKIYSSILTRRLQAYLEKNSLLVDEQNGFRAARSCIDHIFVLCTVLRNRKSLGLSTYLAFIDYKKAFDSVDRGLLMFKLSQVGINGNFYNAISAMFSNPRSRIILNEFSTEYFDCPIGVKQGDCISATLFAIYINDLANQIKESKIGIDLSKHIDMNNCNIDKDSIFINILLYADDIVCLAENENDLQQLLYIVENWCRKWRLEVNLTKTNILHVRPKRKQQSNFMFLFNCRPVEYCKYYKYLGTTINEYLDYNYTAETLSDSAGRALSLVLGKMIKNGGFPYITYTTLVECCVNSVAHYSSEVWGYEQYDSTLKIHLRAARFYLGLPKNAPIPAIKADIDWLEPLYSTQIKMIRQYHRIIKMDNSRLTKAILLWDRELSSQNNLITTWSSEISRIFDNFNLGYFGENIELFPLKETIGTLKSNMKLKQLADIEIKCRKMPQLRTYIKFKNFSSQPTILQKPLSFIQRKFLSKFCVSCLEIKICTGRYTRQPEPERVCKVSDHCSAQTLVETECHFLLSCPAYNDIRQTWLSKLDLPEGFGLLSDHEKLDAMINDINNVKQTAQFIIDAFNMRSRILFMKPK